MIATNCTLEDLKKLPLRAVVAPSARCARRVEHLALLPEGDSPTERCRAAVANAIRLAEEFAGGLPCRSAEAVVRESVECRAFAAGDFVRHGAMGEVMSAAEASRRVFGLRGEPEERHSFGTANANPFPHLADVTADVAARDVFTPALEAAAAVGHSDAFIKGAVEDDQHLLRLDLGSYPEAGEPVDPSTTGPLGAL